MLKPGEIDLTQFSDNAPAKFIIGMTNGEIKLTNAFLKDVTKLTPVEFKNRVKQYLTVLRGYGLSTMFSRRFHDALEAFMSFNVELAPQFDGNSVEFNQHLRDVYLERFIRMADPELADIFALTIGPPPRRRKLRFGSSKAIDEMYGSIQLDELNNLLNASGGGCLKRYAYADDRVLRVICMPSSKQTIRDGAYQLMWSGGKWIPGDDPHFLEDYE